jgi:hypothetical protein
VKATGQTNRVAKETDRKNRVAKAEGLISRVVRVADQMNRAAISARHKDHRIKRSRIQRNVRKNNGHRAKIVRRESRVHQGRIVHPDRIAHHGKIAHQDLNVPKAPMSLAIPKAVRHRKDLAVVVKTAIAIETEIRIGTEVRVLTVTSGHHKTIRNHEL